MHSLEDDNPKKFKLFSSLDRIILNVVVSFKSSLKRN